MPELPEVETVARQLDQAIRGRTIKRLEVLDPLLGRLPMARLPRRRVEGVSRLGKQVVLTLKASGKGKPAFLYLVVHLRMTGRLIWHTRARLRERKHLRARLWLEGGSVLFYDTRRFGTLQVLDSQDQVRPRGVDPITGVFSAKVLRELLGESRQEIKTWLLRQDRLVGLGNIYASEVLFLARVHPSRAAGSLTWPEQQRLAGAIRRVLGRAIALCGTTFSDFQTVRSAMGSYQQYLNVFKREGQACPSCGEEIARWVQQGRSTFFCPRCQPRS